MNHALWLEGWLVTAVTETDRTRTATATYIPLPSTCPKCGSVDRLYRHGVKAIDYRDTPSAGKQLVIRAEVKRFRCQDCLETSMQPLPDIDTRRRMTKRCVQHIATQGVPRTYADLARAIGIDEKTVRNICNERFAIMLAERTFDTPVVLGIDEMTLAGRKRTVFVDVANKRFLDLIDAMNRGKVERWLLRLAQKERVKCVTIDMWGPYKNAVRQLLPDAKIVVDKWHVVSKAGIALDRVRNRSRRASKTPKKNPWAGKRLLQTSRHNLSPMRRMMVDGILANNPLLDAAWNAKEVFYDIWTAKTRAEAERMFDRWAASIPDSVELEFRPVAKMVENWRHEIFAYFDYPITNAYTEAMNGLVKIINRSGRGYSFEAIRAKALLMNHSDGPLKKCTFCSGLYPLAVMKRVNLRPPRPEFTKDYWYDACGSCHYFLNTQEWKPVSEYSGSIQL